VNTSGRFLLQIPRNLFDEMLAQALAERPNECCGLFAGRIGADGALGEVTQRYPLINELKSPSEFVSEPRSMFAAVKEMRRHGIEVLAIYHSHPSSEPVPSRRDLERNWWPNVVNLIVGLAGEAPEVRGWWLTESRYHPADFEIV
jgi:[CysO sulfur-carrier protein]-S-L-cysteine hydrolase